MKLRDLLDPLLQLLGDAKAAEDLVSSSDTQFARRAYVRSLFAYIEGTIWILKHACLHAKARDGGARPVSVGEYALLADLSYELKGSGDVSEQPKFLRLQENLKFAFRIVNRMFGSTIDLKVGSADWQKFTAAIAIRNRITHPKHSSDFDITDAELKTCQDVCMWFNPHPANAINAIAAVREDRPMQKQPPQKANVRDSNRLGG